jgi:hypothetical protein
MNNSNNKSSVQFRKNKRSFNQTKQQKSNQSIKKLSPKSVSPFSQSIIHSGIGNCGWSVLCPGLVLVLWLGPGKPGLVPVLGPGLEGKS